jgi:hypothetical protein
LLRCTSSCSVDSSCHGPRSPGVCLLHCDSAGLSSVSGLCCANRSHLSFHIALYMHAWSNVCAPILSAHNQLLVFFARGCLNEQKFQYHGLFMAGLHVHFWILWLIKP